MNIFTVSFFGHRQLAYPFEAERKLEELIRRLLNEKEYVEFIVGRSGEFDQLAASVIRGCRRLMGEESSSLVLVLPYETAEYRENKASFEEYYSEVEICSESAEAHFRSAHQLRNNAVLKRSDLAVFCLEREEGGAWKTFLRAKKENTPIFRI